MTWYSYGPIDPETILRDVAKKHYLRTGLAYSFDMKKSPDSGSQVNNVQFYMTGGESVSAQVSRVLHTYTGNAPISALENEINLFVTDKTSDFPILWYDGTGFYIRAYVPEVSFLYGSKADPTANASYTGGFCDRAKAKTIQFGTDLNPDIDEQYTVSSGTFYYRATGAGSYTSIAFSGDSVTIPANTFAAQATYEAYADLVCDDGTTCTYTFNTITTVDGTSSCIALRPQNEVTYGYITFVWNYSIPTGTDQIAYDLQISPDGSTWADVFQHVVSTDTHASYTQSTPGDSYWRVRGYNQDDVAGEWSEPAFYVNHVPPEPPVITGIAGTGRKTITWEAPEQFAYHVKVYDEDGETAYDTGEIYSSAKSALINEYLETGAYTFAVAIATETGGWSDWATARRVVSASLAAPQFSLTDLGEGVQISITADAAYERFYVVRNGALIGETQTFINDYFVAGTAEYRVIGVAADDAYGYASQSITFAAENNQIVTEDGEIFLINERWDDRIFAQRSLSPRYSSFEFLGETRPLHVFSGEFRRGTFTVAVYDENNILDKLLGNNVFFNTVNGWGDWCVITSINRAEKIFGNDTAVMMELTAPPERIEYEI